MIARRARSLIEACLLGQTFGGQYQGMRKIFRDDEALAFEHGPDGAIIEPTRIARGNGQSADMNVITVSMGQVMNALRAR